MYQPTATTAALDMAGIISTSHERSLAYGLCPERNLEIGPIASGDLSVLIEQNKMLHTHALPAMETLYQQIINTHNMVPVSYTHLTLPTIYSV